MKKRVLLPIAALLCLALLAGCKTLANLDFDTDALSKAQKIVVSDAEGTEKNVLTEKADIDAFVDAVKIGGWHFAELPEDLTEAGSFTLWQEETVTALFGAGEAKMNEICTLRVYANENYLTLDTALAAVSFTISEEAAEYLLSLTE